MTHNRAAAGYRSSVSADRASRRSSSTDHARSGSAWRCCWTARRASGLGAFRTMEGALDHLGLAAERRRCAVDIGLPGMSGIDGVRLLRETASCRHAAGAHGVRGRQADLRCLVRRRLWIPSEEDAAGAAPRGIRDVVDGGAPMSPEVARRVIAIFRGIRPPIWPIII